MVQGLEGQMEAAWLEAAEQLDIDVEAPYAVDSPTGSVTFLAFLPDFGGPNGMVVASTANEDGDLPAQVASDAGLFYTQLTENYSVFDEERFRDTLSDWGWHGGHGNAPPWYTGHAWS